MYQNIKLIFILNDLYKNYQEIEFCPAIKTPFLCQSTGGSKAIASNLPLSTLWIKSWSICSLTPFLSTNFKNFLAPSNVIA
jgi:hypothetical protein